MPQRRPLAPISGNEQRRRELSPGLKREIFGRADAGQSVADIAQRRSLPKTTVRAVIRRYEERGTAANLPRSGRPTEMTPQDERHILRIIRRDCHITYDRLRKETGTNFANSTFWRFFKHKGIAHWLSKRRPQLSDDHARQRLRFARNHIHITAVEWRRQYIFSDECSVEKGSGKKRLWSFGYPSEKWNHDKI